MREAWVRDTTIKRTKECGCSQWVLNFTSLLFIVREGKIKCKLKKVMKTIPHYLQPITTNSDYLQSNSKQSWSK